jgi:hypothetical protein
MTPWKSRSNRPPARASGGSHSALVLKSVAAVSLFAIWPLLSFTAHNREQLDASGALFLTKVVVATVAAALVGFLALHLLTRRTRIPAAAATVIVFVVLFYGYHLAFDAIVSLFSMLGLSRGENYFYVAVVGLTCLAALRYARSRLVVDIALTFGLLANIIPAVSLGAFVVSATGEASVEYEIPGSTLGSSLSAPSVFHFVADGYARADQLSKRFGFDNRDFIADLEARGFYVATRAYSNYPATFLSISSMMSMKYMVTDETEPFVTRSEFYAAIRGDNPVAARLRGAGYRYVYQGSAVWDGSKCLGLEDLCLSSGKVLQREVLNLTPLRYFLKSERPSTIGDVGRRIADVISDGAPVFLFSHTMPPHPPATFTSSCEEIATKGGGSEQGAKQRLAAQAGHAAKTNWIDPDAYVRDLQCVNAQFIDVVDAIVARQPDAIIVVHGDHGTAFDLDWSLPIDAWPEEQFEERFSILLAVRLPPACSTHLYPTISPVNVYPIVLACLGNEMPRLVADVSFVTPYEKHEQYGTAYPHRRVEAGQ